MVWGTDETRQHFGSRCATYVSVCKSCRPGVRRNVWRVYGRLRDRTYGRAVHAEMYGATGQMHGSQPFPTS